MTKPKILIQLDSDRQASVFDAVVAVDAGVDQLLQYGGIEPQHVRELVHGAIFTRGPQDLRYTAIFIGGADVAAGESLLRKVTNTFFGPMRVSVLLDANGANTTAAAAVLMARRYVDLAGATAVVLAGTGPVGQRVARLLARAGVTVRLASRRLERATAACDQIRQVVANADLLPYATSTADETAQAVAGCDIVFAAGAAGIELLSPDVWRDHVRAKVAIDLNAVPPVGLAGVQPSAAGVERDGVICFGAIGVGGLKMKIHKAALRRLFDANDRVLDAEEIFVIGCELELPS
ncbi:MAG: NADP-dependent methylenetetrahydromethanopterin/methylenetetrahydrofolate dehydrogenase [Pirellulaceae bacterium]